MISLCKISWPVDCDKVTKVCMKVHEERRGMKAADIEKGLESVRKNQWKGGPINLLWLTPQKINQEDRWNLQRKTLSQKETSWELHLFQRRKKNLTGTDVGRKRHTKRVTLGGGEYKHHFCVTDIFQKGNKSTSVKEQMFKFKTKWFWIYMGVYASQYDIWVSFVIFSISVVL